MAVKLEVRVMIRYLREKGYSIRRISKELKISHKAVRRYLQDPTVSKYFRQKPYNSKLDFYKPYITERLNDFPDITAEKICREIKGEGFSGSYRTVAYYVGKVRPEANKEAFLRYESAPGDEAQVDWAEFGRINYYGKNCKLYCFSFILGYSRRQYVEFTVSMDIFTLMNCHIRAFEHFGGVPKKILYDNMKTVVLHNIGGKIDYNQKFLDFANYYGFLPDACDVCSPEQKGKVERSIEYIRTSFFTGEEFSDLSELNSKAIHWSVEIADKRIHGTTHERPIDRWETEKAALSALPKTSYDARCVEHRLVMKDCYINWAGNCYSVPWQYVRKTVLVKATETEIRLYHNDTEIARHAICRQKGKYIRNESHLKGLPRRTDKTEQRYRREFDDFGEIGVKYFEEVTKSSIVNPYYHLSNVLKLKQDYPLSEIAKSLKVALHFKAYKSSTIVNLVKKHIPQWTVNQLEKFISIPGMDFCHQVEERPLEFYDWVVKEKNG